MGEDGEGGEGGGGRGDGVNKGQREGSAEDKCSSSWTYQGHRG